MKQSTTRDVGYWSRSWQMFWRKNRVCWSNVILFSALKPLVDLTRFYISALKHSKRWAWNCGW